MCVDAFAEILWDAGSIPAASTIENYLSNTSIRAYIIKKDTFTKK